MKTTPRHPRFGVRVDGVDLRRVSAADGFPEIRALLEEHSLLLFEDQQVNDAEHIRLLPAGERAGRDRCSVVSSKTADQGESACHPTKSSTGSAVTARG